MGILRSFDLDPLFDRCFFLNTSNPLKNLKLFIPFRDLCFALRNRKKQKNIIYSTIPHVEMQQAPVQAVTWIDSLKQKSPKKPWKGYLLVQIEVFDLKNHIP